MKSIITTLWLCFVVASQILAQNSSYYNSLTVADPRNSWSTYAGTLDAASITARPKGIYTECEVYMTYSSKNTPYTKLADTVEIVHRFTLPKNALVIDSWLWIEGVAERAKIIDRWTASQVYESIVKRRKDPSLLMKNSPTDYEFRIFPMAGNEVRTVKLTFLIPNNWEQNTAGIELPFNLFENSKIPLTKVKLQLFGTNTWKNPQLLGATDISTKTDPVLGTYIESVLPNDIKTYQVAVQYDTPMKGGVYVAQDSSKGNNYYQFAVQPEAFLGITPKPKRLMIISKFNDYLSNISESEYINQISKMLNSFSSQDSFNLIYNNSGTQILSNKWLAITPANIATLMVKLKTENSNFAYFPGDLSIGIDFIKKNGNNANILLALSANLFNAIESDDIINKVKKLGDIPPIHILNLGYYSQNGQYINGVYYYGNDYLCQNLSSLSNGSYEKTKSYSSTSAEFKKISQNFYYIQLKDSDLYSSPTNGYCHSRVNLSNNSEYGLSIAPFIQTGKYVGKAPFIIQLVGTYEGQTHFKTVSVSESDIEKTDSTARQIWVGNYLINKELDYFNLKNSEIKDMIDLSIKNRVLCRFTAFLALDPKLNDPTAPTIPTSTNTGGGGGGVLITTEETELASFDATAFPNPFNDVVTIQVALEDSETISVEVEIFNLSGQMMYKTNLPIKDGKATLGWESGSAAAGMYFAKIKAGKQQKMLKLLKIK